MTAGRDVLTAGQHRHMLLCAQGQSQEQTSALAAVPHQVCRSRESSRCPACPVGTDSHDTAWACMHSIAAGVKSQDLGSFIDGQHDQGYSTNLSIACE